MLKGNRIIIEGNSLLRLCRSRVPGAWCRGLLMLILWPEAIRVKNVPLFVALCPYRVVILNAPNIARPSKVRVIGAQLFLVRAKYTTIGPSFFFFASHDFLSLVLKKLLANTLPATIHQHVLALRSTQWRHLERWQRLHLVPWNLRCLRWVDVVRHIYCIPANLHDSATLPIVVTNL